MLNTLVLIYFGGPWFGHRIKQICSILDSRSRDMLNFAFLKIGLWIVFPPHFLYDFSRKIFLMQYYINWPNLIAWLLLLLAILGTMCIAIMCSPSCDVINFETNLTFLIKPFFVWPKSQDKNLNILRTKRAFKVK